MKKTILISVLIMLLVVTTVLAGFASTFLPENSVTGNKELRLKIGEIRGIYIMPQNPSDSTTYFYLVVTQGNQYMLSELQDSYNIPPGTTEEVKIQLMFKAPDNAKVGDKYAVSYKLGGSDEYYTTPSGSAMIGYQKSFDMVVIDDSTESTGEALITGTNPRDSIKPSPIPILPNVNLEDAKNYVLTDIWNNTLNRGIVIVIIVFIGLFILKKLLSK